MKLYSRLLPLALGAALLAAAPAHAQEDEQVVRLSAELRSLDADHELRDLAAFERLQARQALEALASARRSNYNAAEYVAQRRVRIAGIAARTEAMQRRIAQLERDRTDLIVEASRRDAAQARAEAERLRVQAQIQAEEAARLRQQTMSDADALQDIESALQNVSGVEAARLKAARAREAELARQEAELLRELEAAESDD